MIYSMTGFAASAAELEGGSLALELRSVNSRFLDLQIRMPDELRLQEPFLREAIAAQIKRGKVECRINFSERAEVHRPAQLNDSMLRQLADWSTQIRQVLPEAAALSIADILHWKGVQDSPALPADALHSALQNLLQQVLADFAAARQREGEKLKAFLLERVSLVEALRGVVLPRIPAAVAAYEARLRSRLQEALGNDAERLHQEIALYASKIDVDEELSRLQVHLDEMKRVLAKGGAVGKRLDFLMQELHREANTLGSKSADAEVSRCSMEMKVIIEQMREQIQNIE